MAKTEILLESGTNEIEIMVFTVYGELYGINVAKVKEVMKESALTSLQNILECRTEVPLQQCLMFL